MMFAGYLTAYFTDYKCTFACSTIGALGGAMLTQAYGFEPVAGIVLIRLGYICIGIVLAYVANCSLSHNGLPVVLQFDNSAVPSRGDTVRNTSLHTICAGVSISVRTVTSFPKLAS